MQNFPRKTTAAFIPAVINADNDLITEGVIGWIIWIHQIIKGTMNGTDNIS
jgi:hypothetical protein